MYFIHNRVQDIESNRRSAWQNWSRKHAFASVTDKCRNRRLEQVMLDFLSSAL